MTHKEVVEKIAKSHKQGKVEEAPTPKKRKKKQAKGKAKASTVTTRKYTSPRWGTEI